MATKTMALLLGEWLKREFSWDHCREEVTIVTTGTERTLVSGEVLGRAEFAAPSASYASVGTGDSAATLVSWGPDAKIGNYVLTCTKTETTAAGTGDGEFQLKDPDGNVLQEAIRNNAVAVVTSHINLTLGVSSGAVATLGDTITIACAAGTLKAEEINFSGTDDGVAVAYGILIEPVTVPAGADAKGVVLRRGPAIIRSDELTWPSGATTTQKATALAQLAARDIIERPDA